MYLHFDDYAQFTLAADTHMGMMRRLARKRRPSIMARLAAAHPRVERALDTLGFMTGIRPFAPGYFAVLVLLAAVITVTAAPLAGAAMSCRTEDSAVAQVGTDAVGCVWWGSLQGNGRGDTVWNR